MSTSVQRRPYIGEGCGLTAHNEFYLVMDDGTIERRVNDSGVWNYNFCGEDARRNYQCFVLCHECMIHYGYIW